MCTVYSKSSGKPKSKKLKNWWILFISVMVYVSCLIVGLRMRSLPSALTVNDASRESFIAERAWNDLKMLTGFGARPTGSHANEVLSINFFKRTLNQIKKLAHPSQNITADIQVVSGGYYRGCNPYLIANLYRNVQNVVVRIDGSDEMEHPSFKRNSLMVNCHFDSVPGSPGASDDGASCCVMLEILRVLVQQEKRLRHSVVFLFNGAEETGFQASHGFITQHLWANDIRAFLNLESVGSNGKEMLFQSSPNHGWLIDMYKSVVPHPNAQVIGEEIFEYNLIPSDTDFRIFRDFGNIPGMDFAHTLNGYRYHTKYDHIDYLSPAVLQHTGDNILALVKKIASSDELANTKAYANGRKVYFDLLGFIFISYTETTGRILHIAVPILSVIHSYYFVHTKEISRKHVRIGFFSTLISIIASACICYCIAQLLDYAGKTMSWYDLTFVSIGLYCLPTLAIFSIINTFNRLESASHAQARLAGVNSLWAFGSILITILGYRSAYVCVIPILIFLITNTIIKLTRSRNSSWKWFYIHASGQVFVVLWACHFYFLIMSVFIPIAGRSDGHGNPENIIGFLSCFFTFFIGSYLIPLVGLLRNPKLLPIAAFSLFVLTILSVIFTDISFPYSNDFENPTPQRHSIKFAVRRVYDINGALRYNDSGIWFLSHDRNAKDTIHEIVAPEKPILDELVPLCKQLPFCGLPAHVTFELNTGGFWLPATAPVLDNEVIVQATKPFNISQNQWQLKLTLEGSYLYSIQIQPRLGVKLMKWNLLDSVPELCKLEEKRSYFISVTHGLEATPLQFDMDFETKRNHYGPLVDISIVTVHWEFKPTPAYLRLLDRVPKWAFSVHSVVSVQAFVF